MISYAYAESKNFCFSMFSRSITPIKSHLNRKNTGLVDYVKTAAYTELKITNIAGLVRPRIMYSAEEETGLMRMTNYDD